MSEQVARVLEKAHDIAERGESRCSDIRCVACALWQATTSDRLRDLARDAFSKASWSANMKRHYRPLAAFQRAIRAERAKAGK